ncbi:MAG: DUF1343 domain-containing protein [Bacteroidota bacterium]
MKIKALLPILLFSMMAISGIAQVKTGIEVLKDQKFEILKGKRVGLITNPTGVDSNLKSTIDILHEAPDVNLVALFGPEHGVRGNFSAGDKIDDYKDPKTEIIVYSLYGKKRKPSQEILENIDILVYDIQDIGVRSYTYISTLGLAMEAAAEKGIELVVLDRPNPLGGNRVEGALVEDEFISFVSQYPVPYVYGLTPGEFAAYINETGLLSNELKCDLKIVKMEGWKRDMLFNDTGLQWVPTSPHIPRWNSSFYYALSGIMGELDASMVGIGYTLPFEVFTLTWLDSEKVADALNAENMDGVIFRPLHYKAYYNKNKGNELSGVQVHITDYQKVNLTKIQFKFAEVLFELCHMRPVFEIDISRYSMFDKVTGSDKIRKEFTKRYKYKDIKNMWEKPAKKFKKESKKYYLYK